MASQCRRFAAPGPGAAYEIAVKSQPRRNCTETGLLFFKVTSSSILSEFQWTPLFLFFTHDCNRLGFLYVFEPLIANLPRKYWGWTWCRVEDGLFLIVLSLLVGFVIFPPNYICIYSLEILTCVSFPLPQPLSCDSSKVSLWGKINFCFSIGFIKIIVSFAIVRNTWAQIIRNPNHRHYKSAPPLISPLSAWSAWFPLVLNIQFTPFPNLC